MKLSNILKTCLNYKVLIGVVLGIVLIYWFAPRYASLSWILLALICPLSMVFMMAGMRHANNQTKDTNEDHKE